MNCQPARLADRGPARPTVTAVIAPEVYPKPWTEDVHRLLAFSFGFLAHAGADTPWHSLGHAGGIIQAMEFIEFGSYGDAHTMADVGTNSIQYWSPRLKRSPPPSLTCGGAPQRCPRAGGI